MGRSRAKGVPAGSHGEVAFLLSQVGAHAASRFAERLEPLGLKPPHAGVLRVVEEADGLSQQALGERLGLFPSRLVGMIDDLEGRGLVKRRDSPTDRRSYALYLTPAGRKALEDIRRVGEAHQDALCAGLDARERAQLAEFLSRIAAEQGLTTGVHPNLRRFGGAECK